MTENVLGNRHYDPKISVSLFPIYNSDITSPFFSFVQLASWLELPSRLWLALAWRLCFASSWKAFACSCIQVCVNVCLCFVVVVAHLSCSSHEFSWHVFLSRVWLFHLDLLFITAIFDLFVLVCGYAIWLCSSSRLFLLYTRVWLFHLDMLTITASHLYSCVARKLIIMADVILMCGSQAHHHGCCNTHVWLASSSTWLHTRNRSRVCAHG